MRSDKELLKLLKEKYIKDKKEILLFDFGLCFVLANLSFDLTPLEYNNLSKLIKRENVPQSMREHTSYIDSNYWWTLDKSGMEQRLLFIDSLISKEKPLTRWERIKQMLKELF